MAERPNKNDQVFALIVAARLKEINYDQALEIITTWTMKEVKRQLEIEKDGPYWYIVTDCQKQYRRELLNSLRTVYHQRKQTKNGIRTFEMIAYILANTWKLGMTENEIKQEMFGNNTESRSLVKADDNPSEISP